MEGLAMTQQADMTGQAEEMMQGLAASWGLVAAMGVVSILIGIIAIVAPGVTIVTVAIFFAAWLFISGIVSVVQSFTRDGDTGMRVLHALIGILSVIVGFSLLRTPFQSVEVVIFVLGVFWVAQGIVGFIGAFSRKQGRNWALFTGLLGIIAGIIILQYPISSAVTLALIGGIWLVILGIMQLVGAWQLRSATKAAGTAAAAA
jgi:uncharacterized membrane protein HdeD (DUF308 family)